MDNFEETLSNEILRINIEHDKFWGHLLSEQADDLFKDDTRVLRTGDEYIENHPNIANIDFKHGQEKNKITHRLPRSALNKLDPAAIYMERNDNIRTCQNMNGVLGKRLANYI